MAIHETSTGRNGIGYVKDVQTWSVYEVWLDGRIILEVSVDNADPDLKIYVGRSGTREAALSGDELQLAMVGAPLVTSGRAKKGPHEVGGSPESPGELKDHIDGMSVYGYVLSRITILMADVYVPKAATQG